MISESEKKRLRHHVRTSKRWIRTAQWFEVAQVGITPVQLVDEEGMFVGVQGLKNAKKRLRCKALERYKFIRALDGHTHEGTSAPWDDTIYDPRPLQGPKHDGFWNTQATYIFPRPSPLKNSNVHTAQRQVVRTLTAQPVVTKTSSL